MKQLSLAFANDYKKEFGGSALIGKRKTARPIATKSPMHLVLKTTKLSPFNPTNRSLERIIKSYALKYGINIYNFAVNNSHIHIVGKTASSRSGLHDSQPARSLRSNQTTYEGPQKEKAAEDSTAFSKIILNFLAIRRSKSQGQTVRLLRSL